jgi:hypothetical protein
VRRINTRTLVLCSVVVLLAGAGWFALQTARPECDAPIAFYADSKGDPLPDANGRRWTIEELTERAYREKVAEGACEPPSARWRQWLG